MAVGYPIGLILDNEKGNSQKAATNGILKLQNIYFADMEILGSDANKLYQDALVTGDANGKPVIDETRLFFLLLSSLHKSGTVRSARLTN